MASRASFLTGLYPEQNGVSRLHHKLRDKVPKVATLPQILKENGYHTAAVGKIFHFNVPSGIGSPNYDVDPISWSESHNPAGIDRTSAEEIKYLGPHINEKSKDSNMNGGWLSTIRLGGTRNDYTDGKITNLASKILTNMSENQDDFCMFWEMIKRYPNSRQIQQIMYPLRSQGLTLCDQFDIETIASLESIDGELALSKEKLVQHYDNRYAVPEECLHFIPNQEENFLQVFESVQQVRQKLVAIWSIPDKSAKLSYIIGNLE